MFQCPQMDKSFADQFFAQAYADGQKENTYFDPRLKLAHARVLFDCFREHCPDARRMLEVGAGLGSFAKVAIDAGLHVVATEMSQTAVQRARELYGLDVHLGTLDDLPQHAPFDAVVLWDVIEHCPQPDRVLAHVAERLRPGGRALLSTGNYESAIRLSGGDAWWCWAPDHYHYFRPDGLRRLGERFGFRDFVVGRVARLALMAEPAAPAARPSPLRFLNPLHVARSVTSRALNAWARIIWPRHWDLGVMLCRMTKA